MRDIPHVPPAPEPGVEHLRREMQRARDRMSGKTGYARTTAVADWERARKRWLTAIRARNSAR